MTATMFRAPAAAALSALMEWPHDPPAHVLDALGGVAKPAVAPASQAVGVLVCVWQAGDQERGGNVPQARFLPDGEDEDALTWEDAAWQ